MKVKLGQLTLEISKDKPEPTIFNPVNAILTVQSKAGLANLMVDLGMVGTTTAADKWIYGNMGGRGDLETARYRAKAWYVRKFVQTAR